MYMPLCRDCHVRETRLGENAFEGDPELINVKLENDTINLKAEQALRNQTEAKLSESQE